MSKNTDSVTQNNFLTMVNFMSSSQEARFEFGQNWSDFSKNITETELQQAIQGLIKLLPQDFDPKGKTFLDIGSGSGLHSVAAAKLGFSRIVCTDYDQNSVETTQKNAEKFGVQNLITAFQDDILHSNLKEEFDIVYSWGVLHHTGHMWNAIDAAAKRVKKDGAFIIAIYTKTKFCDMWKVIKKSYCCSPRFIQKVMEHLYFSILSLARLIRGTFFKAYNTRGMNRFYDSIDWLGGYPYESASKEEIFDYLKEDFNSINSFRTQASFGLLGTGCAEYVFVKKS